MKKKLALFTTIVLLGFLAEALPAAARPYESPDVQEETAVAGTSFNPKSIGLPSTGKPHVAVAPVWPGRATVNVALPSARERQLGADGAVQAAGLPVRVAGLTGSPERLTIQSFDRTAALAAGVDGVMMRVSRADGIVAKGPAQITLDYSAFRHAYGGDWASRLGLYVVPLNGGRPVRIASVNDFAAGTVSGTVDVGGVSVSQAPPAGPQAGSEPTVTRLAAGTMVALMAEGAGGGGDYKASTLSPSATWSAGGNTGDFTWSYPLRMPPAVGGPAPTIALAYSSSSVDGRMASTNNQASMIGEGFDWSTGYIERRYNSCAEDMGSGANNTEKTGDQCWETDNASLTLTGHAGELLKDGTNANRWHLRSDDNTFVEHKTSGPNGDNNGEWWLVTTPDGTQYWFGGRSGSNAVQTVPVFGNHSGEQCHQTAFKDSWCNQAYRWNLDHVVDPFGNTMSYTYAKETNKYGRNNKIEDDTVYDRDAYVTSITYGTRTGDSGSAPAQVLFTYGDRCFTDCGNNLNWVDTPKDLECTAASCNYNQLSPTFWTKKRLSTIKTQVWGGTSYRDVEQWTLHHSFPSSDQPTLWLDRVSHSGLIGGTNAVPDVTFVGVAFPNRVDTNNDQYPAMTRYRMKTINSETGGKLDLTYTSQDCVRGTRVPDVNNLHLNTLRCYPVKWQPEGQQNPIWDFFHKYLISDVVEADLSGTSSRVLTHYDYVGDPAWHYSDEDGFIKKDFKTWSVWRGYGTVRTIKGDPGEQTLEERRYFRGMHGDKLPSGTRSVQLPAITVGSVPAVNDEDGYAGMVRETVTYNGPGGAEIEASVSQPWQSAPTASRTINGHTVHARHLGTLATHKRIALDAGRGHQTTSSSTEFDSYGMPIREQDNGDDATTGDEKCTITDYIRNTTAWIVDKASRARVFAVNCAAAQGSGLTEADAISDVKTSYDQLAWNVAPTKGAASKTETMSAYNGGSPTFFVNNRTTHDVHGRIVEAWDVRNNLTTTTYTPAVGGPLTATLEANGAGWTKSVTFEPAWGSAVTTTDANGRKIDMAYDPMGRLTSVWLAGRDRGTQSASIVYEYLIRNNAPTVVVTKRLNTTGGYITSYQLYDNLLRTRQTQESDGAGGTAAVITDTYYDSAGRVSKTHDRYVAKDIHNNPVAPSTNLFLPTGNIPLLHTKTYDGAGRETVVTTKKDGPPGSPGGTEKWRTTTAYGGDTKHVTPPGGATATSSVSSPSGKIVEFRQYHLGVPAGSATGFDKTTYEYNRKDQLIKFTDPAGTHWDYEYDLAGRETKQIDPDKGTITTTYNNAGDILTTTDGRGVTIAYTYDSQGRKTTMRDGSATGPKRSEWVYDTLTNGTQVKGHLVKTIRYEGTDQYIKEHVGYTIDYKPTSVKYTIPNNLTASGVNGSYSYVYTYHQEGSPATTRLPAMGDLGIETLTMGYNALGKPDTLNTSLGGTLVAKPDVNTPGTEYTSFGELGAIHLRHNAGDRVDIVRTYESDTRRLGQIWTTKSTASTTVADVRYGYDHAGNITSIADLPASDFQCFKTDHLRRLTDAWTPATNDCTAAAASGGSKYSHTYKYDAIGNRTELVEYGTPNGTRTTTYTAPAGAHKLSGTSTVDNTGTRNASYTYDASGNTLTRPAPGGGTQQLTWDAEGKLATSTDSSGTTSFVYDVDGNRLLRKDPTGKTLYLPGQELRWNAANGVKNCTRYYTHAEHQIATRTSGGVVWLGTDHHGTAQISVNAVGQATSVRRETPFGDIRATAGTWPSAMDKGFVGGTKDNTGLTHLGARLYDPLIGRFISVDPMVDNQDPQQLHGYSYANNAPITASDPDGLWPSFLDKAVSKVSNAVSTATSAVVSGVKAAGNWVYDNAGTISTVLTVAAIACSVIPPLQVAAPFLGAAATAVGAIETYKSCKSGAGLDCAMGLAELVPGGRVLGAAGRGAKGAKDALDKADDAADAARRRGDSPNACPYPHSFKPATPVVMADGSTKAIKDVAVGDKVLATDPITGETLSQPVTALHNNEDTELTTLTIDVDPNPAISGDETTETIETTWHHPFWDATQGFWVDAAALKTGHKLWSDGRTVTVRSVANTTATQWMRDLSVGEVHTYYVVAGQSPLLVHNCPPEVGHKVDYWGDDELVTAVRNQRLADGAKKSNPNYGAARLDDGSIIVGRSGGGWPKRQNHTEDDLIRQANARGRTIKDLYTERAPCANRCAANVQNYNVTWSWRWNGWNRASTERIRRATRSRMDRAMERLFM